MTFTSAKVCRVPLPDDPPFRSEVERYGEFSKSVNSSTIVHSCGAPSGRVRTCTGRWKEYPDSCTTTICWIRSPCPGSIYAALSLDAGERPEHQSDRIQDQRTADVGPPYPEGYEEIAQADIDKQAAKIAASLKKDGIEQEGLEKKEIVALIAYLQRLGTDIKKADVSAN